MSFNIDSWKQEAQDALREKQERKSELKKELKTLEEDVEQLKKALGMDKGFQRVAIRAKVKKYINENLSQETFHVNELISNVFAGDTELKPRLITSLKRMAKDDNYSFEDENLSIKPVKRPDPFPSK